MGSATVGTDVDGTLKRVSVYGKTQRASTREGRMSSVTASTTGAPATDDKVALRRLRMARWRETTLAVSDRRSQPGRYTHR